MSSGQDQEKRGKLNWINPLTAGAGPLGRLLRLVLLCLVLSLLAAPVVGWYEYNRAFPQWFNLAPQKDQKPKPKPGVVFSSTLVHLGNQMLTAWLPNDVIWPSVLLDNPQNFQMGELEVMRYTTRVLRDKLSRQRTTDKIDRWANDAYTAFSNDPYKWIFPSAESRFKDGVDALGKYQQGLKDGGSHFYARADNLIELLDQLTSLLGGVNTRLANAPRQQTQRLSEETAGDPYLQGEKVRSIHVPWTKIDDNFYFARGVAYSLREVLMAVRWEFRQILRMKRSMELMDNIIAELALANFEPLMVLNGSRDSVFSNHSLKMMATLENSRQKLINLQQMLEN